MQTLKRIITAIQNACDAMARARVYSTLILLGREQVESYGYSWEALRQGPSAYPWPRTPAKTATDAPLVTAYEAQVIGAGEARNDAADLEAGPRDKDAA